MTLLDYFSDWPQAWPLVVRPLLIGLCLTTVSAVLSVIVVLKRLSFAGQGISHSAFGGIGVAAVASALLGFSSGGTVEFIIVLAFCIAAAVLMGRVGDDKAVHVDTGIGLLLVAAMALGGVLVDLSRQIAERNNVPITARSWESVLFGSVMVTGTSDLLIALGVMLSVLAALWYWRRPLLFWAFDEASAPAFGVPVNQVRTTLMVLLAVTVVTSMKLAGVVPATALLVLPGAIALRLSSQLWRVVALAVGIGATGFVVAMAVALQFNLQPGPCVVLVLTLAYALAAGAASLSSRPARA